MPAVDKIGCDISKKTTKLLIYNLLWFTYYIFKYNNIFTFNIPQKSQYKYSNASSFYLLIFWVEPVEVNNESANVPWLKSSFFSRTLSENTATRFIHTTACVHKMVTVSLKILPQTLQDFQRACDNFVDTRC